MANTRESTIFVGGLDNHVTTETLHDAFIPFGEIVDVSLPKPDMASNKDPHRGFGYVEFGSAEDAREAINNMDQSELYGKVIKVNPARPQKDPQEKLGSRTAEGYASKYNVSEEDRMVADGAGEAAADPLGGLAGRDVAGPQLQ